MKEYEFKALLNRINGKPFSIRASSSEFDWCIGGKISYNRQNGLVHLCQNKMDGNMTTNRLDYRYSWCISIRLERNEIRVNLLDLEERWFSDSDANTLLIDGKRLSELALEDVTLYDLL